MGTSRRLEMQIPCQDCELLDISRGGIHRASADLSSARLARRGFPTFRVRMAHPPGTNHVNAVMRASAMAVMRCVLAARDIPWTIPLCTRERTSFSQTESDAPRRAPPPASLEESRPE